MGIVSQSCLTMVRPVVYNPVEPFQLSEADKEKYKQIASEAKGKAGDTAKNVATMADSLTTVDSYDNEAWDPANDKLDNKDGITLDSATVTDGDLDVDISDVFFEEPRVVAEDDDDAEDDERSLWGDGDKDP